MSSVIIIWLIQHTADPKHAFLNLYMGQRWVRPLFVHCQKKTRHEAGFLQIRETYFGCLGRFQVASCQFATLGDNLEADTLTFGQCVHARVL